MIVTAGRLENSVVPNQTAPPKQSDLGPHCLKLISVPVSRVVMACFRLTGDI